MKCPLCESKMFQASWTDTPFYYCTTTGKCAGSDGIYIALIRSIRRKLKDERAAGFIEGHRTATADAAKIFGEAQK